MKSRMKNFVMFVPNMVLLCARLLTDPRVPRTEKALVAGAIIYALIPLDLIPDMLPFIGQVDDAYLIALTLLRLVDRTEPNVLREHWNGGGDIVQLVESVASMAAKLLPKRIRGVLTSRVEVSTEKGKEAIFQKPILVARPEAESRDLPM
ncbi:MAG TPA: DUF1232 domain-containing protein [Pyrinomonadaceae bacterium]|nr:DUF1232 domain-containing protein [Pyrinomonadaceae bacterium]